ncbi:MAG: hypothetical protein JWR26_2579 [Pedosphaera sp.]|nr:hypothetical protein [Pedosphaera sp.]
MKQISGNPGKAFAACFIFLIALTASMNVRGSELDDTQYTVAQLTSTTAPTGEPTDQTLSAKLGLTLEQLLALRARFDLSNADIDAMPVSGLQPLLWQVKHPNIDLHAEAIKFRLLQLRDENGQIPETAWLDAARQRDQMPYDPSAWKTQPASKDQAVSNAGPSGTPQRQVAGIQSNGWTWLGPGNIGGRIRSIIVHPTVPGTMWVGGADGGVWKTTNSGASWFMLDDFMANLAIGSMAIDLGNPNVLYAGTGEGFSNADAIQGAGIFKSTNGGTSWAQLSATTPASFHFVNRLAVNPTNGQIVLAATGGGIYRTTDGGATWTQRYGGAVLDLAISPGNASNCIASGTSLTLYSTDAGVSWTAATGISGAGRIEVAYAPSNPNIVYASFDQNSGQLFGSTNGGISYALINTGANYLGVQGWYDNAIWVDPTNPNILIVGGIDLWRSTNGGTTLTKISQWQNAPSSAHADQHVIVSDPGFDGVTNKTVYFGDDGGIYRATDVYSVATLSGWTSLNNNLGITQFYGAAGNPTSGTVVGGAQDNGTLRHTTIAGTGGWTAMFGGDGGECAADQTDTNYFYGEYVYLQIHRSLNGGASSSYIYTGIGDAGGVPDEDATNVDATANFISPFILDPNNANTMLGGGMELWRSTNVKAGTPAWASIKPTNGQLISAVAVAPGNSDVIWVGHNNGFIYYTTNGTAATPTWIRADLGTGSLPKRYCMRLTVDPSDPNRVYVVFGSFSTANVWRTLNSGVSWSNISGNLPSAPVHFLLVKPADGNSLYIGTEVGVFASANGGANWSPGNDGPANVAVDELFWMGTTLVAATHGRGIFSIPVAPEPLQMTPATGFTASGPYNGPFSITSRSYTLTNTGVTSFNWSLVNTSAWLTASVPSGTLAPGATVNVTISLNAAATNLVPGGYLGNVLFTNLTDGAWQGRQFSLAVLNTFVSPPTYIFSTGTLGTGPGQYNTPIGIAVDGARNLYIADELNQRIQKLDTNGAYVLAWGGSGTNAGQFSSPSGVAVDGSGGVYVADTSNLRIQSFDNIGTPVVQWGVGGSAAGQFINPQSVAADNAGNIYVADTYNHRIQKFTTNGTYVTRWGTQGTNSGQFQTPEGVAVDTNGNVYVADTFNHRIQKFNGSGAYITQWGSHGTNVGQFGFPNGISVDGNGNVFVADTYNHRIQKFNSVGVSITYWGTQGTNSGQFNYPYGVATDASGNYVYVADTSNNRIQVFGYTFPPFVTTQPASQAVPIGTNVSFSVAVSSPAPVSYQWRFNGVNLSGATNPTLSIPNMQSTNVGYYDVVLANSYGSTTSTSATLGVSGIPVSFVTTPGAIHYTNGQFHLQLTGLAAQGPVVVSASSDFSTWTPIFTNPPAFGNVQFIDPGASNYPYRFYRASVPAGP